jgi:ABC-type microcin C transport system duplicated ATPase subunit YejF
MSEPILTATGVKIGFPVKRGIVFQREVGRVQAVDGVDLTLHQGETLAIVGECRLDHVYGRRHYAP